MAEEKKKRWRPSLKAYRALESELNETKETLKLYRTPKSEQVAEIKDLKAQVATLEQSNQFLEKELSNQRKLRMNANADYQDARNEILRLRNRNLWQRILNK